MNNVQAFFLAALCAAFTMIFIHIFRKDRDDNALRKITDQ